MSRYQQWGIGAAVLVTPDDGPPYAAIVVRYTSNGVWVRTTEGGSRVRVATWRIMSAT